MCQATADRDVSFCIARNGAPRRRQRAHCFYEVARIVKTAELRRAHSPQGSRGAPSKSPHPAGVGRVASSLFIFLSEEVKTKRPRGCMFGAKARRTTMATLRKYVSTRARPEQVWDAIRDIGALHTRLVPGFVTDTRLEPGARIVTFASGVTVREPIVTIDEDEKRLVWS